MPTDQEYSISELATLAGITPRTVRYYVSVGLLPSPGQAGPASRYGDAHLRRLRLIRRLQADHLPLAEIRSRLDGLADDHVEEALADASSEPSAGSALDYIRALKGSGSATRSDPAPMPLSASSMPAPPSASGSPGPERSQWDRVAIGTDVEIHIRRPLGRRDQKQVERLIKIAREMLEEEQP